MPFHFASHMKDLVDAVETTTNDRACALKDVRGQVEKCLSDARGTLCRFAETQREKMAAAKHALAVDAADRRATVHREMEAFRRERQEMRARLAETLSAARSARQTAVSGLLGFAAQTRMELKADLAEASAVWLGKPANAGTPEAK